MEILIISLFLVIFAFSVIKIIIRYRIIEFDEEQTRKYHNRWWYKIFK